MLAVFSNVQELCHCTRARGGAGSAIPATSRGKTTKTQIVQTVGACNYVVTTHVFATIHAMKKTFWATHFRANATVMNECRPRDKIVPSVI